MVVPFTVAYNNLKYPWNSFSTLRRLSC